MVGFGMAEIVPFPERKPVEGTLQTVSLDELLSVLAGRTTVEDIHLALNLKGDGAYCAV